MTTSTNELLLSAGSLWEIASLGKLTLAVPFEDFVGRALAASEITLLPIAISHTAGGVRLPFHHRDPFDRLLAAQALAEDMPLLSTDDVFDAYGVARLW
jgi:PIN domain nuclease of toxin-antitoxin system